VVLLAKGKDTELVWPKLVIVKPMCIECSRTRDWLTVAANELDLRIEEVSDQFTCRSRCRTELFRDVEARSEPIKQHSRDRGVFMTTRAKRFDTLIGRRTHLHSL
jgi:hypothetical protein